MPDVPIPNSHHTAAGDAAATPDPTGAELLDTLRAALLRYVVLPLAEYADAIVLWIAASHAQPAWDHAPRLVIKAPQKRCGKSRLLDVVEATCHDPLITINASTAAVYRSITPDPPTILLDEADTVFGPKAAGDTEDLRGLLNAGHQRNRPAVRFDAATRTIERIPTFAMAAFAGIGSMPDTIEDRAVIIRMRRRAAGEHVAPFRDRRDRLPLRALAEQIGTWLRANIEHLTDAEPTMPLEDRAADTWEPLIAVADLAEGDWPARARHAALTLTAEAAERAEQNDSVRLLADARTAFGEATAITTAELLARLKGFPEAPWGEYGPAGLTGKKLADLLREYDIRSGNVRIPGQAQAKGYNRADFLDAWSRYCPLEPDTAGEASQPSQPHLRRSAPGRIADRDGSNRPDDSTPVDRATGPICIICRQPLRYDDGTGTHPNCTGGAA